MEIKNNALAIAVSSLVFVAGVAQAQEDYSDLSLESLLDFKVETPATLTSTTKRTTPASVTTITHQQIRDSGARSLDKVLEMYVPGLLVMTSGINDNIGMRGIMNDRNNKILLAVNGQVMNHRVNDGHGPERMLSMLGDIEGIDVIRGPGSATYGPGAIAGIINIRTFTARKSEGTHVSVRSGQKERFKNFEIRHTAKFDDDNALLMYFGIDDYKGATAEDAPLYLSESLNRTIAGNNYSIVAGEPLPFAIPNLHESYRELPRRKVFLQYANKSFDAYLRYTNGGEAKTFASRGYKANNPFNLTEREVGYEQISGQMNYTHVFNDAWKLKNTLQYVTNDTELHTFNGLTSGSFRSWRENQTKLKVFAGFNPNPKHDVAFGVELAQSTQGDNSPGYPYLDAVINPRITALLDPALTHHMPEKSWTTKSSALVAEWQWKVVDDFTAFIGGRLDDHTYTDLLVSPRLSLVYDLQDDHTFKFLYNRSVRRSEEADMLEKYYAALNAGKSDTNSDYDVIDSLELRYEWQATKELSLAASPHYATHDAVGFAANDVRAIGTMKLWGVDVELDYKTDNWTVNLSHAFIDLIDFTLPTNDKTSPDYISDQHYSAKPYGYGDDLASWSDSSKLIVGYKFNDEFSLSSSLQYFSALPGA